MDAHITGQVYASFEGARDLFTLGFWFKWCIIIIEAESFEFDWSEDEWPWDFLFQCLLET